MPGCGALFGLDARGFDNLCPLGVFGVRKADVLIGGFVRGIGAAADQACAQIGCFEGACNFSVQTGDGFGRCAGAGRDAEPVADFEAR